MSGQLGGLLVVIAIVVANSIGCWWMGGRIRSNIEKEEQRDA